jgi:hypothetical protein
MLKKFQLTLLTWIKPWVVKNWKKMCPKCLKLALTASGCVSSTMAFCRGSLVHSYFLFTYLRS